MAVIKVVIQKMEGLGMHYAVAHGSSGERDK
jgi:hypothetical protein